MSDRSWLRLGAASGVLYVILELVGFSVGVAGGGMVLSLASTDQEIAKALAAPVGNAAWIGLYLEVLAFLFFIAFAGRLTTTLRQHEGEAGWGSATVLGAGILFAVLSIASFAFQGAYDYRVGHGMDVQLASILVYLSSGTYTLSWAATALFAIAVGLTGIRTRAVPGWLSWSSIMIGVLHLIGTAAPTSALAQMPPFLFLIWVVAATVVLWRRSGGPAAATARAYAAEQPGMA